MGDESEHTKEMKKTNKTNVDKKTSNMSMNKTKTINMYTKNKKQEAIFKRHETINKNQ